MKKRNKQINSYSLIRQTLLCANNKLIDKDGISNVVGSDIKEYYRIGIGVFFLLLRAIRIHCGYSCVYMLDDMYSKGGYYKLLRRQTIIKYEQGEYLFLRIDYAVLFYEWLMSEGIRDEVFKVFAAFTFDELLFGKVRYKDSGLLVIDNLPESLIVVIEDRKKEGKVYVNLERYRELRGKFATV